jgi:outer membrane immunogenic protein
MRLPRRLLSPIAFVAAGAMLALPSAAAVPWNGPYVGVNLGGAFGSSHANTVTAFDPGGYFASTSVPAINTAGIQSMSPSGFVGGVELGYDYRIDNIVLGLETEIVANTTSARVGTTGNYPCCSPTTFTIDSKVATNWMATIRPRVGLTMDDGGLFYVTGGYAVTDEKTSFTFTDTFANALSTGSKNTDKSGWTVGAGYAFPWTSQLSVKIEYLYADFGSFAHQGSTLTAFTPPVSFPTNPFVHNTSLTENIVRVGVDWHL